MSFKKWRKKRAKKKKEIWEEINLPNRKGLTIESAFNELELEVRYLKGKVDGLEKALAKNGRWKVTQDEKGKTEWYKPRHISYVSKIYTIGPENAYYFDIIIDGNKVTFDAESQTEAEHHKFELLDIERVEDYDAKTQQKMFGEITNNVKYE